MIISTMASTLENRTLDSDYNPRDWVMYDYGNPGYINDTMPYLTKPEGATAVVANIVMIVVFPVILFVNGMLLFIILKNAKLRNEPWRWLIAHTSLCIFTTAFLLYINCFTVVYHLPSFVTTAICPAISLIEQLFGRMYTVSVTLVVTERFRAMKQDISRIGGMGKKAIIISLTVFWLINIIAHILNFAIPFPHPFIVYFEGRPGVTMCYINTYPISEMFSLIVLVWSAITAIVVFIGVAVLACKNTDAGMRRSVTIPIFIIIISYLLMYVFGHIMGIIADVYHRHFVTMLWLMLFLVSWIIFPLSWLVAWYANDDFSLNRGELCPCCPAKKDEGMLLIEK